MRHRTSHRWILAVLSVLVVGLLGWPAPAGAQLGTVTGTLTNPLGTVTGVLTGITTTLADTGTLVAGTVDALNASNITASIGSLLTADVPSATVIGYTDQIDSGASLAGITITVGGLTIAADSAVAEAMTLLGTGGTATSYLSNLSVNGVSIPVDGSVNQTVALPGGRAVINEQQVLSDGTVVVNALHVTVTGLADVVVAYAKAGPSGGEALAARGTQ